MAAQGTGFLGRIPHRESLGSKGTEKKQLAAWGMIVRKADIKMTGQGEKVTTIEKESTGICNEIRMPRHDEKYVLIVAENP